MCSLQEVAFNSDVSGFSDLEGWVRGEVEEIVGKEVYGWGVFMKLVPLYF